MDEVFETQQQAEPQETAPVTQEPVPQEQAEQSAQAETPAEVQAEAQAELAQPGPQDDPIARVTE